MKNHKWLWLALIAIAILVIYQTYPYLLYQVAKWQKSFNLLISQSLRGIHNHSQQAGLTLVTISFLYGVFHAVGPGHGKMILSSYLSVEQTKISQMVKISLMSALVQGIVAIVLVTVLIAIFTVSRQHFNFTLKWVERGSFLLIIAIGFYWLWQSLKKFSAKKTIKIYKMQPAFTTSILLQNHHQHLEHSENCGCGHQHLPNAKEIAQIQDNRSMWLVIFSIGLRPCTGAVLVLFLSYTLDLYWWGLLSAMTMALGTGLTLTLFASLVFFARSKAVQAGNWYFSQQTNQKLAIAIKIIFAVILIILGILLLHSSFIAGVNRY